MILDEMKMIRFVLESSKTYDYVLKQEIKRALQIMNREIALRELNPVKTEDEMSTWLRNKK